MGLKSVTTSTILGTKDGRENEKKEKRETEKRGKVTKIYEGKKE